MRTELMESLDGSKNMPLWLDRSDRLETAASLSERVETELAIVGAGFTGLWAALLAKEAGHLLCPRAKGLVFLAHGESCKDRRPDQALTPLRSRKQP